MIKEMKEITRIAKLNIERDIHRGMPKCLALEQIRHYKSKLNAAMGSDSKKTSKQIYNDFIQWTEDILKEVA